MLSLHFRLVFLSVEMIPAAPKASQACQLPRSATGGFLEDF